MFGLPLRPWTMLALGLASAAFFAFTYWTMLIPVHVATAGGPPSKISESGRLSLDRARIEFTGSGGSSPNGAGISPRHTAPSASCLSHIDPGISSSRADRVQRYPAIVRAIAVDSPSLSTASPRFAKPRSQTLALGYERRRRAAPTLAIFGCNGVRARQ